NRPFIGIMVRPWAVGVVDMGRTVQRCGNQNLVVFQKGQNLVGHKRQIGGDDELNILPAPFSARPHDVANQVEIQQWLPTLKLDLESLGPVSETRGRAPDRRSPVSCRTAID